MTGTDKARYSAQTKVHKALAHSRRLLIVEELSAHERFVRELTAMVGVEMPTVSRNLSVLKGAGILEDDKRGSQVFYSLKTPYVMSVYRCDRDVRQAAIKREAGLRGCSLFFK
jgi:DNA-binding transcriptional ArsR family regulator